eukprot:jgi/Mesvir1/26959/Mv20677-RA.1
MAKLAMAGLYQAILVASPSEKPANADSWRTVKLLGAGGMAGAVARTCTAPLDRIKLLFQVQHLGQGGMGSQSYTGVWQAASKIFREEGVRAYWKGNGTNIIRIFPYSAGQFMSHEQYKSLLATDNGTLTVARRLMAGALAGMTATALTHPLDTVRLRLALPNSGYVGMTNCVTSMVAQEGVVSLFKGLFPTLIGIAPYAALNFASYDLLKQTLYRTGSEGGTTAQPLLKENPFNNLVLGAVAGTLATTVCYPLDTVRRRMQMKGVHYTSMANALVSIHQKEGIRGFYRGWWANTLKVMPQNSIRFVTYELFKKLVGVQKKKTDT